MMVPDTRGWILVPNYALGDYAFRNIYWKAHSLWPKGAVRAASERDRYLKTEWNAEVYVKSAENPHALIGESLDFLIVDEAARVGEEAYQQARGRLLDRDGWMLAISTPTGRNWFEAAYRMGQRADEPNYRSWNAPTSSNPFIRPDVLAEEIRNKPERIVRQDYLAEFLDDDGRVFSNIDFNACGSLEEPVHGAQYVIGWDVGRHQDYSVLMVGDVKRKTIVHIERFQGEWNTQIRRVSDAAMRYNHAAIVMDATGQGDAVHAMLHNENLQADRPFSRRIYAEYLYSAKRKAELIEALALAMERKDLSYPKDARLLQELSEYEYERKPKSGLVSYHGPQNGHDDHVIALALFWSVAGRLQSSSKFTVG